MATHTFSCIDGHTCGNPVRLVAGGGPRLEGATMLEKRAHFLREFDWIRTGLMFEPRGHDMMSGSILYPPTRPDCDVAVLFIETSGCLPMCGHGTIGTVTMGIENGLIAPREPGKLAIDTPAGKVDIAYRQEGRFVEEVRLTNVPGFLHAEGLTAEVEGLGEIVVDVAYGGNFYAIVEPQKNFRDMADHTAGELDRLVAEAPRRAQRQVRVRPPRAPGDPRPQPHPVDRQADATPRPTPATPSSTATRPSTARPAAPAPRRAWPSSPPRASSTVGDDFVHESIIGSLFNGRVEAAARVGNRDAIIPSIAGWARMTGYNTIFIDDRDPFAHGFVVK